MLRLLLPLAALAACSSADEQDETPAPVAAASPAPAPTASPTTVVTDSGATPRPGALRTFKDWTVGCDNVLICTLASLGPEPGLFPDMTMAIIRHPGPSGGFELAFDAPGDESPGAPPATAVIDGARVTLADLTGAPAARVIAALANARSMELIDANGRRLAAISPAGASAALRYVDEQQRRAGTVTAAIAKGSAPASIVPPAPEAPVVVAVAPSGSPATPTAAQLAEMRGIAGCDDQRINGQLDLFKPESFALGGGRSLVLVPCSAGAYNLSASLFILDGEGVRPAEIDAPSGITPEKQKAPSVVNGNWNAGLLTSYAKGRGLGDCGVRQSFAWDGHRLRLVEQSEMGECRGNPNYITTWRAMVERR